MITKIPIENILYIESYESYETQEQKEKKYNIF